jgi:hypothetical protein
MKVFLLTTALFLLSQSSLLAQYQAKRVAPKDVPDIGYDSIILQRSEMNYVQALDSATKKILWRKKIYSVIYIRGLETDVQDVFIDSMFLHDRQLKIRNEKKRWFTLDLQTRSVKRL